MWNYEKRLQFPVKIDCTSPAAAKVIITQLGGQTERRLPQCGT